MGLPDVLEMEDNAGGVMRLRDGTPLPPYLAMARGLPLPEWYAMHAPTLPALLETLSQARDLGRPSCGAAGARSGSRGARVAWGAE